MSGRVMGLDIGEKTIGVALSDESLIAAQPLLTVRRTNLKSDLWEIVGLAEKHQVKDIIIGLPLTLEGEVGPMAELVLKFCEKLKNRTTIPIHTWDERMTTVAAERALLEGDVSRKKRKEVIDQVAAALILQGWMDRRAKTTSV